MNTPTPATEPTTASIAQAFCEFDAMPNDDGSREVRQSLQRAADWIKQRAREIDASATADHTPTTVAEVEALQLRESLEWAIEAANCSSHPMHKHYAFSLREVLDGLDGVPAAAVGGADYRELMALIYSILVEYPDSVTPEQKVGTAMWALRAFYEANPDESPTPLTTPAAPVGGFVVDVAKELRRLIERDLRKKPAQWRGHTSPTADGPFKLANGDTGYQNQNKIWAECAMVIENFLYEVDQLPAAQPSAKDGVRGEDEKVRRAHEYGYNQGFHDGCDRPNGYPREEERRESYEDFLKENGYGS